MLLNKEFVAKGAVTHQSREWLSKSKLEQRIDCMRDDTVRCCFAWCSYSDTSWSSEETQRGVGQRPIGHVRNWIAIESFHIRVHHCLSQIFFSLFPSCEMPATILLRFFLSDCHLRPSSGCSFRRGGVIIGIITSSLQTRAKPKKY